jgi:hypothetical protein
VSGELHAPATSSPRKKYPVRILWDAVWAPELGWARWRR